MTLVLARTTCTRSIVMYPALWLYSHCIRIWLLDIEPDSVPFMYVPRQIWLLWLSFTANLSRLFVLLKSQKQRMSSALTSGNCSPRIWNSLSHIAFPRVLARRSSQPRDQVLGKSEQGVAWVWMEITMARMSFVGQWDLLHHQTRVVQDFNARFEQANVFWFKDQMHLSGLAFM